MRDTTIRIVLTTGQQTAVKEVTGRDMSVLELDDTRGNLEDGMPRKTPEDIQLLAIRKATRLNEEEEARREWLMELAREQDAQTETPEARIAQIQKEAEAETRREQKRMEAEFKLISAGKVPPKKTPPKK